MGEPPWVGISRRLAPRSAFHRERPSRLDQDFGQHAPLKSPRRYPDFSVDYFFMDNNVFDTFEPDENPNHNICARQHTPEFGDTCGQQGPVSVDDCPGWFKRLWEAEQARLPWGQKPLNCRPLRASACARGSVGSVTMALELVLEVPVQARSDLLVTSGIRQHQRWES